jgi:hypothetical protein
MLVLMFAEIGPRLGAKSAGGFGAISARRKTAASRFLHRGAEILQRFSQPRQ